MGRRKKIVDQCVRLMDQPEQIRNIAIAAHVDHGKCVGPETRVQLATGSPITAEQLFEHVRSGGDRIEGETDAFSPSSEIELVSFDRAEGETTASSLAYATRRPADEPLVRVRTSNGHELETTPEHRFLTLSAHGTMEYERADELSEGDTIVGIRRVPCNVPEDPRVRLVELLSEDYGFYCDVDAAFNERIQALDADARFAAANTKLKRSSFKHAVWRGQFRLSDIVNVCRSFDIPLSDLYRAIETINYRGHGRRGEHSSLPMRLPDSLEPLYYLAGIFVGDGDLEGNVTAHDERMQERISAAASELGLSAIVREFDERATRVEVGGKTLRRMLQAAFDYPTEEKSHQIRISDFVFEAGDAEAAAFIRGYLDADGGVETARSAISVTSASMQMLEDLQLLLYRFDVASKLNRRNQTLYIAGRLSLEHFDRIGFDHPDKAARYAELLQRAQSAKVDAVPIDGGTMRRIREDVSLSQQQVYVGYGSYERNEIGLTKASLSKITERFTEASDAPDPRITRLENLAKADTSFVQIDAIERVNRAYVYDFGVESFHNFAAEGIVVHNTTLSDNLLAGAGMISDETAGQQLMMDTEEDEQERGITIDAANVSMTHEYEGDEYLINLIDTPGHVDFGGDVTRAMRAVDGALVVVDAVEGAMPQTETVLRQALREGVKPALFINKVDRLISELREGPEEMQQRLLGVIRAVNELIRGMTEDMDDVDDWTVSVEDGTVAFGSALYKWGVSLPSMQETGMDFGEIIELEQADKRQELHERTPLSSVVLDMVCQHFPDPIDAQPRRIPRIWRGDADSDLAHAMRGVDDDAEVVFMVTDVSMDPHAGEVATGRVFSGALEKGQELYVSGTAGTNRVQSVGIFMGGEREEVEHVPAGNIAAVTGLRDAIAGSTVSSIEMTPFESIEHISEPVITKSIEAQRMDDLPKLINVLVQVQKEDPTIEVSINEDTGEHLVSGQGELHLEVITHRIERNQGIPVHTGEPIVVYRESVQRQGEVVEGVSPNRHNRFYLTAEPLPESLVDAIRLGEVSMDMPGTERREALIEAGLDKDTAANVEHMHLTNVFVDDTKGIQYLNETMELVIEGIEDAFEEGPLAREPIQGCLIRLHDARLHEDAIHRGPAQVIPAVRRAAHNAMMSAQVVLLEPILDVRIDVPSEYMGAASGELQGRRGRVDDMYQEGDLMVVEGIAPVEEMIGFSSDIRSATEGRAAWNTENAGFRQMAASLQEEKIMEIRERKGLKLELPGAVTYL